MKKIIILISSALLLISGIITIYIFKKTDLKGELIGDKLYYYDLKLNNNDYIDWYLKDDNIYYLSYSVSAPNDYTYWKLNLKTNKKTKIGELKNHCKIKSDFIECNDKNKIDIYDLKLKKIYSETNTKEIKKYLEIIPYKKNFLKIIDNIIYTNKKDIDIETRKLAKLSENISFVDFYSTSNNTYLLYLNNDTQKYIVYDYNADSYNEYEHGKYNKYQNGFIIVTKKETIVLNLAKGKTLQYKNIIPKENIYAINMKPDDETALVVYHGHTFSIENLALETIKELNGDIRGDILTLQTNDKYTTYESVNEGKRVLYVLDLRKINDITIKASDYYANENKELENKKQEIESKYGITIRIKDDAILTMPFYTFTPLLNNYDTSRFLDQLAEILPKFTPEFFEIFKEQEYKGLQVYITDKIVNERQYSGQISGLTFMEDGKYSMAISTALKSDLTNTFCHEAYHNIENYINNKGIYSFEAWNSYNPKDFNYAYTYQEKGKVKYTLFDSNAKNDEVYFISNYAYTYPYEDRAEIFGRICSYQEDNEIHKYPNLYQKSLYLKEELLKEVPALKETTVFQSLR